MCHFREFAALIGVTLRKPTWCNPASGEGRDAANDSRVLLCDFEVDRRDGLALKTE